MEHQNSSHLGEELVEHLRMEPFSKGEILEMQDAILENKIGVVKRRDVRDGYSRGALRGWVKGAGALTSVALLALIVIGLTNSKLDIGAFRAAPIEKTYSTLPGERAKVQLNDGTVMLLAPATTAKVIDRTVELSGQALFTVTHSTGVPFVVKAGGVDARVLGTSFAVRRYSFDTSTQFIVAQGRIAVGPTVLGTGDIATASNSRNITVSRGNVITDLLAWAEGRLVFSGLPLSKVIPEVERWYGINIKVADRELLNRPVFLALGSESPDRVIELLAIAVDGKGAFSGQQAVLQLP